MEKLVTEYHIDQKHDLWETISERFKGNISHWGAIYFKGQSNTEKEFLLFCEQHELKLRKKYFMEYSGRESLGRPFYYLSVQDTRD